MLSLQLPGPRAVNDKNYPEVGKRFTHCGDEFANCTLISLYSGLAWLA